MVYLNYRDTRPIYTQIADNFRSQIRAGVLAPGDKLRSIPTPYKEPIGNWRLTAGSHPCRERAALSVTLPTEQGNPANSFGLSSIRQPKNLWRQAYLCRPCLCT